MMNVKKIIFFVKENILNITVNPFAAVFDISRICQYPIMIIGCGGIFHLTITMHYNFKR